MYSVQTVQLYIKIYSYLLGVKCQTLLVKIEQRTMRSDVVGAAVARRRLLWSVMVIASL